MSSGILSFACEVFPAWPVARVVQQRLAQKMLLLFYKLFPGGGGGVYLCVRVQNCLTSSYKYCYEV